MGAQRFQTGDTSFSSARKCGPGEKIVPILSLKPGCPQDSVSFQTISAFGQIKMVDNFMELNVTNTNNSHKNGLEISLGLY